MQDESTRDPKDSYTFESRGESWSIVVVPQDEMTAQAGFPQNIITESPQDPNGCMFRMTATGGRNKALSASGYSSDLALAPRAC